jgi:shikimate kinase
LRPVTARLYIASLSGERRKRVDVNRSKNQKSNVVLIGMPGSGKSTVGVILAKQTSRDFVDTDVLIQTSEQRALQDIVDSCGYQVLREIEERVLLGLRCRNHVIATGGSAVYSHAAMEHLRSSGVVVFLRVDVRTLESRIPDMGTRGIAKRPDQSFADLFRERSILYSKYADDEVECVGRTHEQVCAAIIAALAGG